MKILIKGRLVINGFAADLKSDVLGIHAGAEHYDETEFDIVLTGDITLDSIVLNGAEVYVTDVTAIIGGESCPRTESAVR